VDILQLFAEEEAAKALLIFDAVRCPRAYQDEFKRLIGGFGNHLAKGIYIKYYGLQLVDLREARSVVDSKRQMVYRDGDYGEFIAQNSVLYMREKRLYVSYARRDDNTHVWDAPYPADLLFGDIVPSAIIRVAEALNALGFFSREGLQLVSDHWSQIHLQDPVSGYPPIADPQRTFTGNKIDGGMWKCSTGGNMHEEENFPMGMRTSESSLMS
jgi:hypothetical protein